MGRRENPARNREYNNSHVPVTLEFPSILDEESDTSSSLLSLSSRLYLDGAEGVRSEEDSAALSSFSDSRVNGDGEGVMLWPVLSENGPDIPYPYIGCQCWYGQSGKQL